MKSCILVVLAILLCSVVVVGQPVSTSQPAAKIVRSSFGKLPLYFVENRGVYPPTSSPAIRTARTKSR